MEKQIHLLESLSVVIFILVYQLKRPLQISLKRTLGLINIAKDKAIITLISDSLYMTLKLNIPNVIDMN
jgi:hypothetical protein